MVPARPLFALFGLVTVVFAGCIDTENPTGPLSGGEVGLPLSLEFAKEVKIDGGHRGGEPSVVADHKNHYYVSAPSGMVTSVINPLFDPTTAVSMGPQNRQSFVWKSEDEGATWKLLTVTQPPLPPLRGDTTFGGADTDLAVDACNTLYLTDLWLGNIAVSHSTDGGKTWTGVPVTGILPVLDRQWIATDGCGVVYLGYQTFYEQVWVLKSTDYGMTFPQQTLVLDCGVNSGCYSIDGNLVVDPVSHNVYMVLGGKGGKGTQVAVSMDKGKSFDVVQSSPARADTNNIFPVIAVDNAGHVYVSWSEHVGGSYNVYLARTDDAGATWTAPVAVSGPETSGTEVFPWLAAGDEGRLAVVWYGNDETVEKTDAVKGDWFVYMSATTNAHEASATWTTAKVSEKPMHKGEICTRGLYCTLPPPGQVRGNRNLADFFEVGLDMHGRALVAYSDDYETGANMISLPYFAKQTGGVEFLAEMGGMDHSH